MGLLDSGTWHGKIYSGGWTDGSGGDYPVRAVDRAELGRIGPATAADVHKAAAAAADAQRDWAALPYSERAAVLRRAGDLWHAARRGDHRLADAGDRRDRPVRRVPGA